MASLEQLLQSIPRAIENEDLRASLRQDLETLRRGAKTISTRRHQQVAHLNLDVILLEKPDNAVTINNVHESLQGVEAFIRRVAEHFYGSESWSFQGDEEFEKRSWRAQFRVHR